MGMMNTLERLISRTEIAETYRASDWMIVALIVAVGTFLRFWGLGNVGLHGDEKTTIFPALAVLEQGSPYFPSGLFYGRALAQTYLIAGSVWMFGESEWAARLPSAIVGSAMPLLAYFLGKRFLSPKFNFVFISVIALLPALIALSQMARMYIFLLAALMLFGSLIFRWERDNSLLSLIAAFLAWLVALQFQVLSVLAAPMFLFPGLIKRSWPNLIQGVVAVGFCYVSFVLLGDWVNSFYPTVSDRPAEYLIVADTSAQSPLQLVWGNHPWLVVVGVLIGFAVLAWSGSKVVRREWALAFASLLLGFGFMACAALHYHIGVLAMFFGTVIWVRTSNPPLRRLFVMLGLIGILAAIQAVALYQTGEFPGRKLIGAFVGQPSIWPVLRFAEYSPVAIGLYGLVFAYGAYKLATRQRIPDHLVLFALTVWAPLLAIGTETWYLPPRYTIGALPFLLLCCIAGLEYLARERPRIMQFGRRRKFAGAGAL